MTVKDERVARILEAIQAIQKGVCARVDVDKDTKVYRCKNVIRIDIKEGSL